VLTRLLNCHLLFLGYSLRDWNLRAILYQLREKAKPNDCGRCDVTSTLSSRKRGEEERDDDRDDPGGYLVQLRNAFETWLADRS